MENKLDKNNIENLMGLTSTQEGMLYHYISEPNSIKYHEQLSLTLCGDVKVELLQKALDFVIETNELLRTVYRWEDIERPVQIILKNHAVDIVKCDLSKEQNLEDALCKLKNMDLNKPIDITAETLRVYLCSMNEDKYEMIISNHHILYDGWSNGIILKEFMNAYDSLCHGKEPSKIYKNKFKEFVKFTKSQNKAMQKEYWGNYLSGFEENNSFLNRRSEEEDLRAYKYELSEEITERIKNYAKENRVSLAAVLYCTWGILLQYLSSSEDVVFGTTVSGRNANIKGIDDMVGLFINTIPLRVKLERDDTVAQLIKKIHKSLKEREDFESTALVDIKEYCHMRSTESLFETLVVVENYPLDYNMNTNKTLRIDKYSMVENTNYNITLGIMTFKNIELHLSYNNSVVSEELAQRIAVYFKEILESVVSSRELQVKEIEVLAEEEKKKLIHEFNNTDTAYTKGMTLNGLFEEQAEKTPDKIAVVFEEKSLTYKELNERANRLAKTLRDKGVVQDKAIGIIVEPSLELAIGMLAIMKAGGAYLPIDPEYPEDRIMYILKDSSANIVLTQPRLTDRFKFIDTVIDLEDEQMYSDTIDNLPSMSSEENLAYIIYTSGSTGMPKGVMIEHRSIATTLQWRKEQYELSSKDSVLQLFSSAFDGFVTSFYTPIISGAKVVILNKNEVKDVFAIKEKLAANSITHFISVPSMCSAIMECLTEKEACSLRIITLAGESLNTKVVEKCKNLKETIEIVNEYGPTENSVVTTIMRNVNIDKKITIGKPKANTKIFILNNNNKLQPICVPGEICISGGSLARGYLNRDELTKQRFVENPILPGTIMYKTGDLGRWLHDGSIEFLGRIDHQVKIRGFRIELEEIEKQILSHDLVKEAVVIDKEINDDKYLCAYIAADTELEISEIKEHLSKKLPGYMIPSYFLKLDKMPVTSNGKIDRRALPEPESIISEEAKYEAPRDEVDEKLARIWQEVLGVKNVSINDNFFEMGGHSLKATMLVSKIHKEFKIEIPIKRIFNAPTIKEISGYIKGADKKIYSAIEKVEEREYYEAASAQKRIYMLQQLDLDSTVYNIPAVMEVEGKLESERLEYAVKTLIERHEGLRTSFETIDDGIVQRIIKHIDFEIQYMDYAEQTQVEEVLKNFVKPFDLRKAPLLRVGLIKVQPEKHILMFDIHHIIADGTSMGILIDEFMKLYGGEKLRELKVQYRDYSHWQYGILKSARLKAQEEYWVNRFNGEIPVLNMPTDYQRPSIKSFDGNRIVFSLNKVLSEKLNKLSKETETTLYMVLLSAVNILLSKYSGQEDIVVGSPIAGRPHADLERVIGMFVNTLAMRNEPKGEKNYEEFLKEVKENALKAYENQDFQFEELVDRLNVGRDMSRNPIFDVMFVLQNMEIHDIHLKNTVFKQYSDVNKTSKFDLTIIASDSEVGISFEIEYSTKLFRKETVERMAVHLENVLELITTDRKVSLKHIELPTGEEKQKILNEFNSTYTAFPEEKAVQELFEEAVEKTPNNIALVFNDEQLTYAELNQRANSLARVLRSKGVGPDTIVGIMVDRSFEMVAGIMGILKAGGAYLPIDPEYPWDRVKYMLEDSKTQLLLTQTHLMDRINFHGEVVDLLSAEAYAESTDNLKKINTSRDLAYVIYTSGSTGRPKGVMMEHSSVVNLILDLQYRYPMLTEDAYLMKTTFTFDVSISELFGYFFEGGKLVILPPGMEKDPRSILRYSKMYGISHINFVPSMLNLFLDELSEEDINVLGSLKYVFAAGEKLTKELFLKFYEKLHARLENLYGPTETTYTTGYSVCKQLKNECVPIGKPLNNVKVYIKDKNDNVLPIGVPGELCVSGRSMARGYLNNSKLTEARFIKNPFAEGERIYRTGDLSRWLPDGNIEYLGRIDQQVKIRGFRIELGEIESNLLTFMGVSEAVVVDKEDEYGSKYLCAYLVSENAISVKDIREHLLKRLPDYMVPSFFVQLKSMPLTSNGKIDRKVLPKPEGSASLGTEYEAPRNTTEERLSRVWQEVLGIKNIGINDNFFELGGHSLKATVLVSRIHKEFDVEIPLKEIFSYPTIKKLGQYIKSAEKNIYSSIEKASESEYYEAASAQKRVYMLQQFNLNSTVYNMPAVLEVEGELDAARLEEVFNKLIDRHETLRTSFHTRDGEIIQKLNEKAELELECIEITGMMEEVALSKNDLLTEKQSNAHELIENFIRPFDLSKAPLLRAGLIKLGERRNILLVDMHHIISDGVSMGLFISEFTRLYEGQQLEKLRVQYKDYSKWQNKLLKSEEIKKQEKYWLETFSEDIPVLEMPTDYARPAVQSFEGRSISYSLDSNLVKGLNRIGKATGSTMYMVLLSAVNILLSKYSGQEDIIVGSPIAGRPHADLEKIIGMFVNTLPMRNNPSGEKSYEEFLREIKENALKAFENQDYQFEELIDKLNLHRDISRNPLFDVMFTMQNMSVGSLDMKDLRFKNLKLENKISKFDLTLSAIEQDEEIEIGLEYCTKLFKAETIHRIMEHFKKILNAIVEDQSVKLKDLEFISQEEKKKLTYEFNATFREYPRDKTIHELFDEQVERTPNKVAVVFEDKKLTYMELQERANSLAGLLREKGVKPDSVVGILAERSMDMVVGVLAILKAGGAYLPIDPEYPEERVCYMLQDCNAKVLLIQRKLESNLNFHGDIINISDKYKYTEHAKSSASHEIKSTVNAKNLAYIIYTSGSTGKPKGVMVEHRSVVRLVKNMNYITFREDDRIFQTGTLAFDASTFEIWGAFLNGMELHLASKYTILNTEKVEKYINENNITILWLTTALFNFMAQEKPEVFKNLRYLMTGGEVMSASHMNRVLRECKALKAINFYGPTENTTFSTSFTMDKEYESNIPIGKPISNSTAYIVDKYGKLAPVGVYGELCVGGDGLSRGYINNFELTKEKFVQNPFVPGEKMYKTGDLVRWLPDGNIEFKGRIDHQIKLRGFRIELGEIENQILSYEGIQEAIVIPREDQSGNKYLCAYLVTQEEIKTEMLREYMSKKLPDYMVPAYFIQLEKMPVTLNGKVDRRALPEPVGSNSLLGTEYKAPRNEIEEVLVAIWKDVLGIEQVGIKHNFFELGGHSLRAMQVISQIEKHLKIKIEMADLFNCPTISGLSNFIGSADIKAVEVIERLPKLENYELSYSQKRLWIINELHPESIAYNMPGKITLLEKVNVEIVKRVFEKLIERHEALRTKFQVVEGNPVQVIEDISHLSFEFKDISEIRDESKHKKREEIFNELAKRTFNLQRCPLLYVALVKVSEEEYDLDFSMHHIISDGWSMQVLKTEFFSLYNAEKEGRKVSLEPLRIQYRDFASWQNSILKDDEKISHTKDFWLKQLSGQLPLLELPVTYTHNSLKCRNSSGYKIVLPEDMRIKFKDLSQKHNTSLFIVILASFKYFLSDLTKQKDILIGTAGFGRNHSELNNVMGYFVNTTILRNEIFVEECFEELLLRIKANTLKALEYQHYPVELILDELKIKYPKINVFINMLNMGQSDKTYLEDLQPRHIEKVQDVKFDLVWYVTEYANGVEIMCNYLSELFDAITIEFIMDKYVRLLGNILDNTTRPLKELNMKKKRSI